MCCCYVETDARFACESDGHVRVDTNAHWLTLICIPLAEAGMAGHEYFSIGSCCGNLVREDLEHIFSICNKCKNQDSLILGDVIH